ncbi:multidrug transporter [Pandoraea captiosa]|uniref:Multidrug transporter n=1 Tax=Pandoraea captiosa TaxID=2508302 RepID=A0A5E4ZT76_9BURK|nr:efflux transporter outer membrane subunit [Pandoraea captiosa]VVE64599.1 multidrug transporter [Pandoraea captiosa]
MRIERVSLSALSVALCLQFAGCAHTLAPAFESPPLPVPKKWEFDDHSAVSNGPATVVDVSWQHLVADSGMRQVISLALDNNRDLRVAALNILKARAQYQIRRADLLPNMGVGFSATSERTPASVSVTGYTTTSHAYEIGFGTSAWELDLFGRIRSLKDAALQQYLSTVEVQRATKIGLIAEVANAYLQLAATDEQLALARDTEHGRQLSYEIQRQLFETGSDSDVALKQAQAELQAVRDERLALETTYATNRHALDLLVGQALPPELLPHAPLESMLAIQELPAGLPSDLLERRPDIIAAEHLLRGADANIGAARAAFFPEITLTGGIGQASASLGDLFVAANRVWTFMPQISVPIFAGGRLQANLDVAKADQKIAIANYEHAIQTAFREVADALSAREKLRERLDAQRIRVDATRSAFALTQARYDGGVDNYLSVLDAQRTMFSAQQLWISTRLAKQENILTLYKALGGDWRNRDHASEVGSSDFD